MAVALVTLPLPDIHVAVAVPAPQNYKENAVLKSGLDELEYAATLSLRVEKLPNVTAAVVVGVQPLALCAACHVTYVSRDMCVT